MRYMSSGRAARLLRRTSAEARSRLRDSGRSESGLTTAFVVIAAAACLCAGPAAPARAAGQAGDSVAAWGAGGQTPVSVQCTDASSKVVSYLLQSDEDTLRLPDGNV